MPYQEEILNPCGEPDNDGGTDNNDGNGGGTGGEVDESTDIILEEKFLVPNQTLQNENGILTSADREINLIQPNLFFDTSGMSRLSLRTQDYREKTKFQIATTSSASMDLFRVCLNKLWSWTGASEEWLENETYFGEPTTYNQPKDIFQYEISNESFENGWGKFWQNDLKIVFNSEDDRGRFIDIDDSTGQSSLKFIKSYMMTENGEQQGVFNDYVFSAEQPFFREETDRMMLSQFTSAEISAEVDYFETLPEEKLVFEVPEGEPKGADGTVVGAYQVEPLERRLTSLYRYYDKTINEEDYICFEDGHVQKFTCDAVKKLNEANESVANVFPARVNISINTQQGSRISTLLDTYQMDKYVLEFLNSDQIEEKDFVLILDETLFNREYTLNGFTFQGQTQNDRISKQAKQRTSLDFPDPFGPSGIFFNIQNTLEPPDGDLIGIDRLTYPIPFEYASSNEYEMLLFTDTIRSQIFRNKFESLIMTSRNIRSFSDIMSGKKAFSEILGYKIEKYNIGKEVEIIESDRPVQTFYLMDSDEIKTINFIDTQVRPGSKYIYRISTINFVLGSQYYYFPNPQDPTKPLEYTYLVQTLPLGRIVEAPFFEKVVRLSEKPPLSPQVSFLPFQGIDNKMQILIQSNFGERKEIPISILPSDQEIIQKMLESQQTSTDGSLEYATDSLPKMFQVFRLSSPPESYEDFKQSDFITDVTVSGRSFLFLDENFQPNKNYYYMFRAFDEVGVSNPTDVYRVKMISYENGIYMDLEQYEMRPKVDPLENILFQKLLKISPSNRQRGLQFGPDVSSIDSREFALSAPDIESLDLGVVQENSVWGRKFRFRITSQISGRKIDINVRFNKVKQTISDLEQNPSDPTDPCSGTDAFDAKTQRALSGGTFDGSMGSGEDSGGAFY